MPKRTNPTRPVNLTRDVPAFCTIAEAAKTLAISRSTCNRWIAAGTLQATKIAGSVRVKTASIVALSQ